MTAACSGGDAEAPAPEPTESSEPTGSEGSVEESPTSEATESAEEPSEPAVEPPARITDKGSGFSFVLPGQARPQERKQRLQGAVITQRVYEVNVGDVAQAVAVVQTPPPLQIQEPSAVADQVVAGLTSAGGEDVRVVKESEGSFVGMPGYRGTITFTSRQGDTCYWRLTTATSGRRTLILQTIRFAPRTKPTGELDQLHSDLEKSVRVTV